METAKTNEAACRATKADEDGIAKKIEEILETGGIPGRVAFLTISGAALLLSFFEVKGLPFNWAWIAIVLCGLPIILKAIIGLVTAFDIKADVLVATALVASLIIGEYFAAGEVAFIMQIGELLEDITVARARAGIEKLVKLTPTTARVINAGEKSILPSREVKVGDMLRVLPGEIIPVDGVVTSGNASINEAVITGESMPTDKTPGSEVKSGTMNMFGAFTMQATRIGEDSSMQRMIRLVQSTDASKAKIVGIADRWATWIVAAAFLAAAICWLVTGEIIRAVTVLVVFCPCALVLATPTAIVAAIGNLTRHGVLVKEGDALEKMAQVKILALDKTGTITYGKPQVISAESVSDQLSSEEVFRLAASAEALSEHPLGKAITASYKDMHGKPLSECEDFKLFAGLGVAASAAGKGLLIGNKEFMEANNISTAGIAAQSKFESEGCTVVYCAVEGTLAGCLALSDTLREGSAAVVGSMESIGIKPVLLTGDNERAAKFAAEQVGIREFRANCLPEDKLKHIAEFEAGGKPVCMVGDGVNDAPALKQAYVGVAMAGIGSDIAIESADIALTTDDISALPHMARLAKRMIQTIKTNIIVAMGINFLAVGAAIAGVINPVIGALVHNGGSVLVIINSGLLLLAKDKRKTKRGGVT